MITGKTTLLVKSAAFSKVVFLLLGIPFAPFHCLELAHSIAFSLPHQLLPILALFFLSLCSRRLRLLFPLCE